MITQQALALFVSIIAGMLLFYRAGRGIAARQRKRRPDDKPGGTGAVDGAIFGLMGLLLAFTFSGASTRFEARRSLIAEEANTIGTAYLRLDLLPEEAQPPLREDFRRYVHSRLTVYKAIPDVAAVRIALDQSREIQEQIWKQAVDAAMKTQSAAVINLVVSALNQMIDITTTRTVALEAHPPAAIFVMLFVAVLASSLLAGYNMALGGSSSIVHIAVLVLLVGVSVYVILDYEYPRAGLFRIDPVDAVLAEQLSRMK